MNRLNWHPAAARSGSAPLAGAGDAGSAPGRRESAATATLPGRPLKTAGFVVIALALVVWATPSVALVTGVVFALVAGTPFGGRGRQFSKVLLQACVILLGFGMDLPTILRAGWNGSLFAALTIATTLLLGYWLGRQLEMNRNTSVLISAGTAICGGSAIAAVGSVVAVTGGEIAVAMGTVFLLNGVALYLFPWLGHLLHLSPHQFGVWAGVAIHDISSVVGSAVSYGNEALETATAVKLSRTLWIVPVTLGLAAAQGSRARLCPAGGEPTGHAGSLKTMKRKLEFPWFIGLFLLASLSRLFFPGIVEWSPRISQVAKGGLTLVLCLVGAGLSREMLRAVGWKAAVQGVVLWGFISAASLLLILFAHAG